MTDIDSRQGRPRAQPDDERLVELLSYVGQIVSSSKSLDTILYATLNMIRTMLDVERTSIMILDPVERVLRLRSSTVIPENDWAAVKVPVGESISGLVAREGRPVLVEDIMASPYAHLAQPERYKSPSFIVVPIQVKGRTIGVVNANNRPDQEPFTRRELELMNAIAGFVGLAIENARLSRASENIKTHLECVMESLHHGIVSLNLQGEISHWNQRFLSLLGLESEATLPGQVLREVLPRELWLAIEAPVNESCEYAVETRTEVEFDSPGLGKIPLEVRSSPLTDARGRLDGVLVTLADLTIQRQLAELRRVGDLEANFLAMVSHELRTPLTSIKGAVSLLDAPDPPAGEQQRGLTRIISTNADRLIRIVNDLLDVVSIEHKTFALNRTDIDLTATVSAAVSACEAVARLKEVRLERSFMPCRMYGDSERLKQMVWQLVDNAIKFSPRAGKVDVVLSCEGPHAVFTVRDQGSGIPAASRARIFDRFYQTEGAMTRRAGGTGVGLYLAQVIVEGHGGVIEAVDPEGEGAVFRVTLPLGKPGP